MYIHLTLGNKVIDDTIRVNYQFCWFSQDFSSNTFAHSIWSDEGTDTLLYQQVCNMKHPVYVHFHFKMYIKKTQSL